MIPLIPFASALVAANSKQKKPEKLSFLLKLGTQKRENLLSQPENTDLIVDHPRERPDISSLWIHPKRRTRKTKTAGLGIEFRSLG